MIEKKLFSFIATWWFLTSLCVTLSILTKQDGLFVISIFSVLVMALATAKAHRDANKPLSNELMEADKRFRNGEMTPAEVRAHLIRMGYGDVYR